MAVKPPSTNKYPLEYNEDGRPRFHGCSKVQEYEWVCKLGEGTFGEVSKARSKKTGQIVALKKILVHNEKDGFPITALREIRLLKQLDHPNVLKLEEMAVERPKDITKKSNMFMVTPYMDHDLSGLLKNPKIHFTEPQIKCYMKQLLEGCRYLHESRILHRDMKAANLLISNRGILQIADFGLARTYDDAPPEPGKGGGEATRQYTTLVVTRWYRPPELLLQLRNYTTAIDMWGVGCVFGEMFKRKPILQGDSDLAQAQLIFNLVGSPTEENMPGWQELPGCEGIKDFGNRRPQIRHVFKELSPQALSLLEELLRLDWRKRINAIDALEHPYFHTHPLPARPEDLPVMEDSHEFDKQKAREERKPPPAPAGGTVGIGPQNEYGFDARPRPYDRHGRGGRHFHANGGRRPPPMQNGEHTGDHRGPRPLRDNGPHDHGYRQPPRGHDDLPHDRNRRPYAPYDEPYSRRPLPPPDTALPPRPPPADVDTYHSSQPPHRDDGRGPPPLRRVPPGADSRVPAAQTDRNAPAVDTYIPSYSSADPGARPPRNVLREPGSLPRRPPPRDESRPNPRGGRGPSAEYDDVLRYDDSAMNGVERPPPAHAHRDRVPPPGRGHPQMPYDRRRSRSPAKRGRESDRERERERWHNHNHPAGGGSPRGEDGYGHGYERGPDRGQEHYRR